MARLSEDAMEELVNAFQPAQDADKVKCEAASDINANAKSADVYAAVGANPESADIHDALKEVRPNEEEKLKKEKAEADTSCEWYKQKSAKKVRRIMSSEAQKIGNSSNLTLCPFDGELYSCLGDILKPTLK